MTGGRIALIVTVALVAGGSTVYAMARQTSIRHAGEAIARANEYFDSGALFFEPRYADAEKAVSEANSILFRDPQAAALLRMCLSDVKLSRQYLDISTRAEDLLNRQVKDGDAPQTIAESRVYLKNMQDKLTEFVTSAHNCAPAIP